MDYKFFTVTDNGYIFKEDFPQYGIRLQHEVTEKNGGTHIKWYLEYDGQENVLIKKCGFRTEDIDIGEQPVIFIDPGVCAWAGVKRLDYLDENPRMKVCEEQLTGENGIVYARFHRSDLQTVISDGKQALLIGFTGQKQGNNKIDIFPSDDMKIIDSIEIWQELGVPVQSGVRYYFDDIVILNGVNPYYLLETYADIVQSYHNRKFDMPPITGMMTWYGYHASVTQEVVLENAGIIKDFFGGYPQESEIYMLLDHGWQSEAEWGSLNSDKDRFPQGMKWLGEQMKSIGVKFGIWHTPFCITEYVSEYDGFKPLMALDQNGDAISGKASVWSVYPHKGRGSSRKINY